MYVDIYIHISGCMYDTCPVMLSHDLCISQRSGYCSFFYMVSLGSMVWKWIYGETFLSTYIYMYTSLYVCNVMCCLRFDNAWLLHNFSLLELATHCIAFVLCCFYHLLATRCILMAPSKRFWVLTHTQVWLYSCHRLEKWIHVAIFFLFWWYSLSEDSLSENVRHSLCEEGWSNL